MIYLPEPLEETAPAKHRSSDDRSGGAFSRIHLIPALVAAAGTAFTIFVCYPGTLYPDAINQMREARAHHYTDWHPPVMAFLWHYLDMMVRGPVLMLLMQVLLWFSGLFMIAVASIRNRFLQAAAIIVVGLWPALAGSMGAILKDIQMVTTYTCAVGLFLWYRENRKQLFLWSGYLLLAYGTAVRHNALVAVVPLLLWISVVHYRNMRAFAYERLLQKLAAAVAPLLICLAPMVANKALTADDGRIYVQQILFIYDLGALSTKTGKVLFPEFIQTHPLTLEEVKVTYTPISAVPMLFAPKPIIEMAKDKKRVNELQKAWIAAVRDYTRAYLAHRWEVFLLHLGFGERMPLLLPEGKIENNEMGFAWNPSALSRHYWRIMDILKSRYLYLFRPWIYCVGVIILFLISTMQIIRRRANASTALVFALTCSGLLYLLSYLPLSVSADFRYTLWTTTTGFLSLMILPSAFRATRSVQSPPVPV